VVIELRECNDDVQLVVTKTLAKRRPRSSPITASRCDWKLDRGRAMESSEENDEQGQI
jgi:hypothetical protein